MSNERHIELLDRVSGIFDGLAAGLKLNPWAAKDIAPPLREAVAAAKEALSVVDSRSAAALNATGNAYEALTPRETFDPQAVRELLEAIHVANANCPGRVWQLAERVRESEKKQGGE